MNFEFGIYSNSLEKPGSVSNGWKPPVFEKSGSLRDHVYAIEDGVVFRRFDIVARCIGIDPESAAVHAVDDGSPSRLRVE